MRRVYALVLAGTLLMAPLFTNREMNSKIYTMQQRLRNLGYYNIKATGVYADLTKEAISRFQQSNGLSVTGDMTASDLDLLHSTKAKPYYREKQQNVVSNYALEDADFESFSSNLTSSFKIIHGEDNSEYKFTVSSVSNFVSGGMDDMGSFALHQKTPVIAVIDGKNYPASLEVERNNVSLYFKGSADENGMKDAQHDYNIERLRS